MSEWDTGSATQPWKTTGAAGRNIQSSTVDPIQIVYLRTDPHRAPRHRRLVNVPFISNLNNYQKCETKRRRKRRRTNEPNESWRAKEVTLTHKPQNKTDVTINRLQTVCAPAKRSFNFPNSAAWLSRWHWDEEEEADKKEETDENVDKSAVCVCVRVCLQKAQVQICPGDSPSLLLFSLSSCSSSLVPSLRLLFLTCRQTPPPVSRQASTGMRSVNDPPTAHACHWPALRRQRSAKLSSKETFFRWVEAKFWRWRCDGRTDRRVVEA